MNEACCQWTTACDRPVVAHTQRWQDGEWIAICRRHLDRVCAARREGSIIEWVIE